MKHKSLIMLVLTLMLLVSFDYLNAWTSPTQPAPNGNVAAPVNTGTTNQNKNANLGVNGLAVFGNSVITGTLTVTNNIKTQNQVWANQYCDKNGANCFSTTAVTSGGAVGQAVYNCPATPTSDGCGGDTCVGQLQNSATCIDGFITAGGGKSGQQCKNKVINCTSVGHLVP